MSLLSRWIHFENHLSVGRPAVCSTAFSRRPCFRSSPSAWLIRSELLWRPRTDAGSGIKYAIEDAVVAAKVLSAPLKSGRVRVQELAEVQRRREWPTRIIQAFGAFFLEQVIGRALRSGRPIRIPRLVWVLFRLPFLAKLFARLVAFGLWRVHVGN
jgi:hypothetical protein